MQSYWTQDNVSQSNAKLTCTPYHQALSRSKTKPSSVRSGAFLVALHVVTYLKKIPTFFSQYLQHKSLHSS
jgi:hypothetical protein